MLSKSYGKKLSNYDSRPPLKFMHACCNILPLNTTLLSQEKESTQDEARTVKQNRDE